MQRRGLGYFDPNGVFWRVNRELALVAGGGAALIMQVAHPKIGTAVYEHSTFFQHPLKRLLRTVSAMQGIIFADQWAAQRMIANIDAIHAKIKGDLRHATRVFAAHATYSARDPELSLWVYATLVATAVDGFAAFFHPLTTTDEARFFEESKEIARLFGVSQNAIPHDLAAFRDYYQGVIEGGTLEITPVTRRVVDAILTPPIGFLPKTVRGLSRYPALGLLPPAAREHLGLVWTEADERRWQRIKATIRWTLARTPASIRVAGPARRMERVLARKHGPV